MIKAINLLILTTLIVSVSSRNDHGSITKKICKPVAESFVKTLANVSFSNFTTLVDCKYHPGSEYINLKFVYEKRYDTGKSRIGLNYPEFNIFKTGFCRELNFRLSEKADRIIFCHYPENPLKLNQFINHYKI